MESLAYNNLIGKLEEGTKLNIVLLSHNAYWPCVQILDDRFENCNVTVFADSTNYIKNANIQRRNRIENSDLIVFYSSGIYNEKELLELKNIAFEISNNKNKRVSIGYSYFIPVEQRQLNIDKQIKIVSFKNSEEIIEEINPTSNFTVLDLIGFISSITEDYNIQNRKKLEKK